jgi:glyoxylase-like metal-dependent hydrolase (beta-lactamase superfamily II)
VRAACLLVSAPRSGPDVQAKHDVCGRVFEQVSPTVRYAKAPTGIGVVTHGDRALLLDSGLDENLARKVVNALANEGVQVSAVLNTHAHADHIGGNAWVVKRTGAKVVAPAFEHLFVERPELEPYTLYGAPAPLALQGKFLKAAPSRVDVAVDAAGERDVEGFRVKFHALPGHSVAQMGVEVDGALFVGDALLPPATIDKYGLVFAVDPLQARASSATLAGFAGPVVSYHGGLLDDVPGAVKANVEAVGRAEERILARLAGGRVATTDDIVLDLLDAFGGGGTLELHALHGATVRAYLASLERAGRVEALLHEKRAAWRLRS